MSKPDSHSKHTKPFLKWAGGKFRVLDKIKKSLPNRECLIEPFVGSGAVFLNTNYEHYKLNDINPDVINVYRALQHEGMDFIQYCQALFISENNQKLSYLELREEFNHTSIDNIRRQQLFIYLNRHCYNGLCRYNSKGIFNVPFGSYKKPYFPLEEMHRFSKKLNRAELYNEDFSTVMSLASANTTIYCDPPYVPLNNTANFTNYTNTGFGIEQQHNLVKATLDANEKGAHVIISNHDNEQSRSLYESAKLKRIYVKRSISCNGKRRKRVAELIAHYHA